jgi:hypothetical protein
VASAISSTDGGFVSVVAVSNGVGTGAENAGGVKPGWASSACWASSSSFAYS